jgi:hypothetical protein
MSHALENKLFSCHYKVTSVVDFGIDFGKFTAGEIPPPASGVRFDIWVEGKAEGKIQGTAKGADYLYVRGDGRMELNVRVDIATDDGARISFEATGVGTPIEGTPKVAIVENVKLLSNHENYAWVNNQQVWGIGEVNLAEGTVDLDFYGV